MVAALSSRRETHTEQRREKIRTLSFATNVVVCKFCHSDPSLAKHEQVIVRISYSDPVFQRAVRRTMGKAREPLKTALKSLHSMFTLCRAPVMIVSCDFESITLGFHVTLLIT